MYNSCITHEKTTTMMITSVATLFFYMIQQSMHNRPLQTYLHNIIITFIFLYISHIHIHIMHTYKKLLSFFFATTMSCRPSSLLLSTSFFICISSHDEERQIYFFLNDDDAFKRKNVHRVYKMFIQLFKVCPMCSMRELHWTLNQAKEKIIVIVIRRSYGASRVHLSFLLVCTHVYISVFHRLL